ncbi:hypothetical protein [Streptomyces decoyicus]|uniref:hypothetical protein n=1 Tax=Streptomyces decoyicus TaxID=249567 RepID=UPI003868D13B
MAGGLGEGRGGVVAGNRCVVEGGGESEPVGFGEDLLGQVRERPSYEGGLPLQETSRREPFQTVVSRTGAFAPGAVPALSDPAAPAPPSRP